MSLASSPNTYKGTLLAAKLKIPPLGSGLVARPRLTGFMNQMLEKKLLVITAPPGFGKTTLVKQWYAATLIAKQKVRVAWFSIDENDNDPVRFWTYFLAALGEIEASLKDSSHLIFQPPAIFSIETIIEILAQSLSKIEIKCVVVLDDYHLVNNPAIHEQFATLLDYLPPNLQLTITSREVPPLQLSKLRVREQLAELDTTGLKFTLEETKLFVSTTGLDLNENTVLALEHQTDGWIAALKLFSLKLQNSLDSTDHKSIIQDFDGSHHLIAEYLAEEVLQHQPPEIRSFLLETAMLDSLTASLCSAVTGREDAGQLLGRIEKSNLFLVPLDEQHRWYRYHDLFKVFLVSYLEQNHPALINPLHLKASTWYNRQGLFEQAFKHSIAAADFDTAVKLLENSTQSLLRRNQITTLLGCIEALPKERVKNNLRLTLLYAWIYLLTGQITELRNALTRFEVELREIQNPKRSFEQNGTLGPATLPPAELGEVSGEAYTIQATLLILLRQLPEAQELANQALACLPQNSYFLRNIATWSLAYAQHLNGELALAAVTYQKAYYESQSIDNIIVSLLSLGGWGDTLNVRGFLNEAMEVYKQAVAFSEKLGQSALSGMGMVFRGIGEIHYHRNQLAEARHYLELGNKVAQQTRTAEVWLYNQVAFALLEQAEGKAAQALQTLATALIFAKQNGIASFVSYGNAKLASLQLIQGDLASSIGWATKTCLDLTKIENYSQLDEYLTLAQLSWARGEWQKGLDLTRLILAKAESWEAGAYILHSLVLEALLYYGSGAFHLAFERLASLLTLTGREGYKRIYLDLGEPVARLLNAFYTEHYHSQPLKRSSNGDNSGGFSKAYLIDLLGSFNTRGEHRQLPQVPLVTPSSPLLSEREKEVLELLESGLSYAEMAKELVTSVNTVKTHLKNIYAKLEVNNRTRAIIRARELKLL